MSNETTKQVEESINTEGLKLSYNQVSSIVDYLKGQVLTAIESLGLEQRREKAFKDIIFGYFGSCINKAWKHSIGCGEFPPEK